MFGLCRIKCSVISLGNPSELCVVFMASCMLIWLIVQWHVLSGDPKMTSFKEQRVGKNITEGSKDFAVIIY